MFLFFSFQEHSFIRYIEGTKLEIDGMKKDLMQENSYGRAEIIHTESSEHSTATFKKTIFQPQLSR